MAGLLDYLSNVKFEPNAAGMGLLNMGAQILANSGPSALPQSPFQSLGHGINGFAQGMQAFNQQQDQNIMRDIQRQQLAMQESKLSRENSQQAALSGIDWNQSPEKIAQVLGANGMAKDAVDLIKPKPDKVPMGFTVDPSTGELSPQPIKGGGNYMDYQIGLSGAKNALPSYGEPERLALAKEDLILNRKRVDMQEQKQAQELNAPKPLTEFQGKSMMFGTRAQDAHEILNRIGADYSPAAVGAAGSVENVPLLGWAANSMLGDKDQEAMQAQRNFLTAVLRQESGASISPSEFSTARKQYFPQPGDSKETIAQKKATREAVINGFKTNAGSAAAGNFDAAPPLSEHPEDIRAIMTKHGIR